MSINIGIRDRQLNWLKSFGYIDDKSINKILSLSSNINFKCLKYLDKYDDTFFNSKQWPQLKKEIDILRNNQDIPDEIIMALYNCLEDVKNFPDQYFGFIGD